MFKTQLGEEWFEKLESCKNARTPEERHLMTLETRRDLEKLKHTDIRLRCWSSYVWEDYEELLRLSDADIKCYKAEVAAKVEERSRAQAAQEGEQTTALSNGRWLITPKQRLSMLDRLKRELLIQKKAVNEQTAANLFHPSYPLLWDGRKAKQANLAYFIMACIEGTPKGNYQDKIFEPPSNQYWIWAAKCFIGKQKKTFDHKTLSSEAHRFAQVANHREYIDDIIYRTYHSVP